MKQYYQDILPMLRVWARSQGYALAMHGTGDRDLDIIAVPWTEEAVEAEKLVEVLAFGIHAQAEPNPTQKPHGRVVWIILLGGGMYIDLSVLPRQPVLE